MIECCFECGFIGELEDHHIIPRSLGGIKTVKLCLICHSKVHETNFRKDKHSELIKNGLENAKSIGKQLGRRKGSNMKQSSYLDKYPDVKNLLNDGCSIREVVENTGVSLVTVFKVRQAIKKQNDRIKPSSI